MIIKKIREGCVVQCFDTVKKKWISQDFIGSDAVEYEDENGAPVSYLILEDEYLPFNMHQPDEEKFTLDEIRNYISKIDSLGDALYNLSAESIKAANEPDTEKEQN